MSALSREELKTILHFGVHLAKLDDDFSVWERELLAHFATCMKLTEAEKHSLMNEKFSLGKGLRSLKSDGAETLLIKTLCAVAHVDGEATGVEVEFVERVVVQLKGQAFLLSRNEWGQYVDEVKAELAKL